MSRLSLPHRYRTYLPLALTGAPSLSCPENGYSLGASHFASGSRHLPKGSIEVTLSTLKARKSGLTRRTGAFTLIETKVSKNQNHRHPKGQADNPKT